MRVDVSTDGGSYPVFVGDGASSGICDLVAGNAPGGRVGLISDTNVGPLHAERIAEACRQQGLDVVLQTFPAGESSKTRRQWSELTDGLLDFGLGRDGCV
ncbi:MAG: 3-dehydroquinate synthase, partial [Gemmatimonadetes bacterium]|nr:3-dehydroquinate synthase [Gemmatimonadota bacterium]